MTAIPTLFTIGHSTLTFDRFLSMLREHDIRLLADVRSHPGSHRLPHFGKEPLRTALLDAHIAYRHMPLLGGRRSAHDAPPHPPDNTALRNASFRSYAAYMHTALFLLGLEDMILQGCRQRTAIMCAEALPWRCHRGLLSDVLVARGCVVEHIMSAGPLRRHALHSAAVVDAHGLVQYPAPVPDVRARHASAQVTPDMGPPDPPSADTPADHKARRTMSTSPQED